MTTIVIDPVRQVIVADSRGTRTSNQSSIGLFGVVLERHTWISMLDDHEKIHPMDDGCVIVGAGDATVINRFAAAYPNGICSPRDENTIILVIKSKSNCIDVVEYSAEKAPKKWGRKQTFKWNISAHIRKTNPVFIGSGRMYARGAYDAGCSLEESVIIAGMNDVATNDRIRVFDIKSGSFIDDDKDVCDNE